MSGIRRITEQREEVKESQSWGRDLWLKNGDQAFVACVATGGDDDPNSKLLGQVFLHNQKTTSDDGGDRWNTTICKQHLTKPESCSLCEEGNKPQHRFAMWVYVYHVLHTSKKGEWEATQTATGGTVYKEVVNSFKMLSLGFGKSDNTWNQVCAIYEDAGSLAKNIIRVKRTGEKLDTSYTITALSRAVVLEDEAQGEIKELPSIEDYFLGKVNNKKESVEAFPEPEIIITKKTKAASKKPTLKIVKEELDVDFGEDLGEEVPF